MRMAYILRMAYTESGPQVRVPESTKIGVILNDYRIITIYNMQYL